MEKNVQLAMLLDFYGLLLTERQRDILSLHVQEDLSYGEIAQELGISRQGAADAVRKAGEQLAEYEKKLGMLTRHRRLSRAVDEMQAALDGPTDTLREKLATLRALVDEEDEHAL